MTITTGRALGSARTSRLARVISVSLVPSIIFAHDEAISKQTPSRPVTPRSPAPRDRLTDQLGRPHTAATSTLHFFTQHNRTTQHSTAQHSTQARPTRGRGRGRRPSGPQPPPNEMAPRRPSTSSQTRPGSPGGPSSRPSQLTFLRPAQLALSLLAGLCCPPSPFSSRLCR